jgi:hypothetical protein
VGIKSYTWYYTLGEEFMQLEGMEISLSFTEPGVYDITLRVEDHNHHADEDTIAILVKPFPPVINEMVLIVGPVLDDDYGDPLEGVHVSFRCLPYDLNGTTDEEGKVHFNITSDLVGRTASIILRLDGYENLSIAPMILMDGNLSSSPIFMTPVTSTDDDDDIMDDDTDDDLDDDNDGIDEGPDIMKILVVVIMVILLSGVAVFSIYVIRRSRDEDTVVSEE